MVESNLDRVVRIEIKSGGEAGGPEVYAEGLARVPDGMAFDANENLYVTTYASNCIYRVTPERRVELLCRMSRTYYSASPRTALLAGPTSTSFSWAT